MGMDSDLGKRLGNFESSYYNDGLEGQCVWYVRGRAKEKVGVDTGIRGNANTWYNKAKHKGRALKSDSIACFGGGTYGHVIYIELVEKGNVYYTEANANADNKLSSDDGILKKTTVSKFTARRGYQGCIYLMDYKNKTNKTNKTNITNKTNKTNKQAITTANLNYRKTANGTIAGTLPCGSKVTLDEDDKRIKAGKYYWRKIVLGGQIYYVADEFIKY